MRTWTVLLLLVGCNQDKDAGDTGPGDTDPADTTPDTTQPGDDDDTTPDPTDTPTPDEAAWDYILFSPLGAPTTWLVDHSGETVNRWDHDATPGQAVYLLDDGTLMRAGAVPTPEFIAGGSGGVIQQFDWDGELLWEFDYATDLHHQHHDFRVLPTGNVLMIAWEVKTEAELLALGRDPALVTASGAWMEHLVEVDPATDQIVWEWHVSDHVAQDREAAAANYVPSIADAPGRIDLDYAVVASQNDWMHFNGIDYHPDLDQIVISVHNWSEVWIIDHATTTAEAAGPAGDLLYRWGNPEAWGAGTAADQELMLQHNAQWIDEGLDGAGDLLIFDNGDNFVRPWSRIVQITPPVQVDGSYELAGTTYGPSTLTWEYTAPVPTDLYASFISGVQRQPEGTTLICDGPKGRFFGVDAAGVELWEFDYGGSSFRAERYSADHPALAGRTLTPTGEFPQGGGGPGGPAGL